MSSLKRPETQPIATEDDHKALEPFVLALSDQHLVTGLAILLAGFDRCDISLCSFSMVFIVLRIHRCDCKTVYSKDLRGDWVDYCRSKGGEQIGRQDREGRAAGQTTAGYRRAPMVGEYGYAVVLLTTLSRNDT